MDCFQVGPELVRPGGRVRSLQRPENESSKLAVVFKLPEIEELPGAPFREIFLDRMDNDACQVGAFFEPDVLSVGMEDKADVRLGREFAVERSGNELHQVVQEAVDRCPLQRVAE